MHELDLRVLESERNRDSMEDQKDASMALTRMSHVRYDIIEADLRIRSWVLLAMVWAHR